MLVVVWQIKTKEITTLTIISRSDIQSDRQISFWMQLDVLIWDEKLLVLFIFSTLQNGAYPTYRSNSVTHWKNLPVEQFINNDSADDFDDK